MHQLTNRQRDVVECRFEQWLTEQQTAERLRIQPRRVRQLVAAARDRLAQLGVQLETLRRGRRAEIATAASQFIRNRAGESMNLDTLHAA